MFQPFWVIRSQTSNPFLPHGSVLIADEDPAPETRGFKGTWSHKDCIAIAIFTQNS